MPRRGPQSLRLNDWVSWIWLGKYKTSADVLWSRQTMEFYLNWLCLMGFWDELVVPAISTFPNLKWTWISNYFETDLWFILWFCPGVPVGYWCPATGLRGAYPPLVTHGVGRAINLHQLIAFQECSHLIVLTLKLRVYAPVQTFLLCDSVPPITEFRSARLPGRFRFDLSAT